MKIKWVLIQLSKNMLKALKLQAKLKQHCDGNPNCFVPASA
jgi:hypothetical protein